MQFGRGIRYGFGRFYTSTIDADVAALVAFGSGQGYSVPSGSTQTALNTYVTGLKSAGIWTKLDVLYVFATDGDSDFATLNLKDPDSFQCTKVNSPTFTSLEGFTGNGTSSYLNTNWDATNNGVNYALNSSSFGAYIRQRSAPLSDASIIGSRIAFNNAESFFFDSASVYRGRINQSGSNNLVTTPDIGFYNLNRSSSNLLNICLNGSVADTDTAVSSSINALDFYILALNGNGTASLFHDIQVSVAYVGSNLTSKASDFFTLTEAYMDSIGKGIIP